MASTSECGCCFATKTCFYILWVGLGVGLQSCHLHALTGVFDSVQDATSQDIRALFAQFGAIKPQNGAITVKHNGNNNSFAYVDFVDVASAQACVEAKDVQLYGTTVRLWLMIDVWLSTASPPACGHSCICVLPFSLQS